ncbi:hypothetical protein [Bacillus cereus]|nr:hypothetical protein [Bacillus cereus]EEM19140.1 hypothetical protein bthur0001_57790 [Bacillus thuringiensis serovar tochigiensis BGSC 4Y1]EJR72639.1 hypothetical protein IK9_05414 [Bacillus cereus VD166]
MNIIMSGEAANEFTKDDGLGFFRGLINGFLLVLPIWTFFIGGLLYIL